MKCFHPGKPGSGRFLRQTSLALLFFSLLSTPSVLAVAEPLPLPVSPLVEAAAPTERTLPRELGEVLFHTPGEGDKQIYIIGHSHRSSLSGANGSHTVRSQVEVYRIGEWLITQENIRLLLPEGFFKKSPSVAVRKVAFADAHGTTLDNQTLEARLSDTNTFVNADILLKSCFPIHLQQVEDPEIYRSVGQTLQLASEADNVSAPLLDQELSYLQEMRSAAMLQNIPAAVEKEFSLGNIDSRRAMFTIGMAHVDEIVRFLRDGRITVKAPQLSADDKDLDVVVELIKQGYGVTVILPRTLVDDQDVMRMANLGTI